MPRRTSSLVWFAGRRNPRLAVVPVRVLAAAAAVPIVARRLVSRPARARALARLARLAARGPAPRSRTAPIRERHRGAAAAHTVVVVAPVAAHLLTYGKRQGRETARNSLGGASRTPVAEGGGALWKARRSISPREKSGEKSSVGSAPRGVSALGCALQVAIVVVRERSHLERVGDRCGSLAFRLSQRNSTHMLGASPLTA